MNIEIPENLTTASMSTLLTMLCYFLYKGLVKGRFRSKCCRHEVIDIDMTALRSPDSSSAGSSRTTTV